MLHRAQLPLLTERGFGLGWATLRLPERSQAEGDGLTAYPTNPLSLSDANTARVGVQTRLPDCDGILMPQLETRELIAPSIGCPLALPGGGQDLDPHVADATLALADPGSNAGC